MSTTFWIQLLGMIFGISMMYLTFIKRKREELNNLESFILFIIWIILILVGMIPSILDPIIEPLNFHRRLDFFVVIGFFLLLGVGFYNYGALRKLEKRLELFIRKDAIKNQQKDSEKHLENEKHIEKEKEGEKEIL